MLLGSAQLSLGMCILHVAGLNDLLSFLPGAWFFPVGAPLHVCVRSSPFVFMRKRWTVSSMWKETYEERGGGDCVEGSGVGTCFPE